MPTADGHALIKDLRERNGTRMREVLARFGLAFYRAQEFESQLAIIIMLCEHLRSQQRSGPQVDTSRVEVLWRKTLGGLLKEVPGMFDLLGLQERATCAEALKARNQLAHGFWSNRSDDMATIDGMQNVCNELDAMSQLFIRARLACMTMALRVSHPEWDATRMQTEADRFLADALRRDAAHTASLKARGGWPIPIP